MIPEPLRPTGKWTNRSKETTHPWTQELPLWASAHSVLKTKFLLTAFVHPPQNWITLYPAPTVSTKTPGMTSWDSRMVEWQEGRLWKQTDLCSQAHPPITSCMTSGNITRPQLSHL